MALIDCPECGNKVSEKAKVCVHCGFPLNQDEVKGVPVLLKVEDIQEILGCGIHRAYDIVNQRDFPKIKIGRQMFIPKADFEKWISTYLMKEYKIMQYLTAALGSLICGEKLGFISGVTFEWTYPD